MRVSLEQGSPRPAAVVQLRRIHEVELAITMGEVGVALLRASFSCIISTCNNNHTTRRYWSTVNST